MKGLRWLLILVWGLAACTTPKPEAIVPPPPPKVPKIPVSKPSPLSEGSLFADGGNFYFFEDYRAKKVGDLVTIKIVENYQSSQQVSNQGSRSSGLKAGIAKFLGLETFLGGANRPFTINPMFDSSYKYNLNAQSQTQRATTVTATVTARVVKVLPNGNLVVQAKRVVKQDADLEYIVLTGIIRPQDIDADNSVLSTQLSDVTLEYSGKGANKEIIKGPGWITRLVQFIWPF